MNTDREFIIGVNPILEKLKTTPNEISAIFFARGKLRPILRTIETDAQRLGIKINYIADNELDRLANGLSHQGVLAQVPAYSYSSFSDLEKDLTSEGAPRWVLILDGVTDPRNFGAILRTAEAVGVRDVIVPKDRAVGITPAVVKASAGAISHLHIYRVTNLRRAILSLKDKGFWIVGLDANSSEAYDRRHYPNRLGIVLGSEGQGIRPLVAKECDYLVQIPMLGEIASLNVSVAGGILLYELLRQQRIIDKGSANG